MFIHGRWTCLGTGNSVGGTAISLENFRFTNPTMVAGTYFTPMLAFDFVNNSFQTVTVPFPVGTITGAYSEGNASVFNRYGVQGDALGVQPFTLSTLQPGQRQTFTNQAVHIYKDGNPISSSNQIYFDKPGVLKATFDKLGLKAEATMDITNGTAEMQNVVRYVLSMTKDASGNPLQGKINNGTDKISLDIPFTKGLGTYPEVTVTQTPAPGQDGGTQPLTLKIEKGNFSAPGTASTSAVNGNIKATIEVGGLGEYLVKQMEIAKEYTIAEFTVNFGASSGIKPFTVKIIGNGGWTSTQSRNASGHYTKNNCPAGQVGHGATYTSGYYTATAISGISQADADSKAASAAYAQAQQEVFANGQAHANAYAGCYTPQPGQPGGAIVNLEFACHWIWADNSTIYYCTTSTGEKYTTRIGEFASTHGRVWEYGVSNARYNEYLRGIDHEDYCRRNNRQGTRSAPSVIIHNGNQCTTNGAQYGPGWNGSATLVGSWVHAHFR